MSAEANLLPKTWPQPEDSPEAWEKFADSLAHFEITSLLQRSKFIPESELPEEDDDPTFQNVPELFSHVGAGHRVYEQALKHYQEYIRTHLPAGEEGTLASIMTTTDSLILTTEDDLRAAHKRHKALTVAAAATLGSGAAFEGIGNICNWVGESSLGQAAGNVISSVWEKITGSSSSEFDIVEPEIDEPITPEPTPEIPQPPVEETAPAPPEELPETTRPVTTDPEELWQRQIMGEYHRQALEASAALNEGIPDDAQVASIMDIIRSGGAKTVQQAMEILNGEGTPQVPVAEIPSLEEYQDAIVGRNLFDSSAVKTSGTEEVLLREGPITDEIRGQIEDISRTMNDGVVNNNEVDKIIELYETGQEKTIERAVKSYYEGVYGTGESLTSTSAATVPDSSTVETPPDELPEPTPPPVEEPPAPRPVTEARPEAAPAEETVPTIPVAETTTPDINIDVSAIGETEWSEMTVEGGEGFWHSLKPQILDHAEELGYDGSIDKSTWANRFLVQL